MPIFGSDEVADVTGAGDTVIATFGLALAAGRVVLRSGAARQLRRRPRRHEARHGDGLGAGAVRRRDQRSRHDARDLVAGRAAAGTAVARLSSRQSAVGSRRGSSLRTHGSLRISSWSTRSRAIARRGGPSRSPTAASICCTSATCATCRRAAAEADRLIVAVNDDRSVAGAERARAVRSCRPPSAPSSSPRFAASTTSSSSATRTSSGC